MKTGWAPATVSARFSVNAEKPAEFCSIYPWRPNPCRIFDHEECAVVKNDPDFVSSCRPQELLETCQWLSRLLNGRWLPLGRADIPDKGPEFLELHGVEPIPLDHLPHVFSSTV